MVDNFCGKATKSRQQVPQSYRDVCAKGSVVWELCSWHGFDCSLQVEH